MTQSRREIARVVSDMPGAFTIDDLAEQMRANSPRVGSVATVYRAVAAMEESGFLERVGTRQGSALYAMCTCRDDHHHHVICDGCGRTTRATCPVGPELAASVAAEGFTITRHEMTLYGLCSSCSTNEKGL
jgi:Fur family transcriptional regulator, ferric uptake regulator